ncbi:MAG TPA: 2Fe-2S iron-sulfur cluster binding domain-containing protein [Paenibacillus sp.]|uniref:2Fe-2S iron-sulfur cluster binding domain-containing protein n=1 Tax=Paenibacillus sp. TaxID=58172 RepID=UPI002B729360|nr:2Fe-2S iron-sulfur cluster binding domain-containing protein [Paenibacillus sp.]HUC94342.1 2Fe-2S iron-sulfur cluster binding domain-containing protein [Paenibacillus sp.]
MMKAVTIQAVNNGNKTFTVAYEPGKPLLELVNRDITHPRIEGIPFLCNKGACRSCTVMVKSHRELLDEPSGLERRALAVGSTAIGSGYRLACLCRFRELSSQAD